MIYILIFILSSITFLIIFKYLKDDEVFIEFPFLFGIIVFGFVLPQIISLLYQPNLPEFGLEKTVLMTIFCIIALYLGYNNKKVIPFKHKNTFNSKRLLYGGIASSLIGGYFFWAISRLPQELTNVGQWTGLPVAYLFFAEFLSVGLVVLLFVYLKFKNKVALVFIIFDLFFFFDRIFIAGRRSAAITLVFIFISMFWFTKKKAIPRKLGFVIVVVGFLFVNLISQYRYILQVGWGYSSLFLDRPLPSMSDFSSLLYALSNIKETLLNNNSEFTNAVYSIAIKDRTLNFDYGLIHWNGLIFNFFPSQIFGTGLKQSLMFTFFEDGSNVFNYSKELSTSSPGIIDAFNSFWYFGAIKFYLVGFIIRKFYVSAEQSRLFPILLFPFVIVGGLLVMTHGTQFFIYSILIHILYLYPIYIYARNKKSSNS